jgi:hypothetical protein
MSSLQEIWTSRVNQTAQQDSLTGNIANTFVGQQGRLWYNPDNNSIYVYGNVPGGVPVGLDPNANITVNNLTANSITTNTIGTDDSTALEFITDVNFNELVTMEQDLSVTGNISVGGNISPATTIKIGGVRAGPGANISNTGLLTIDTAGLPLSFGNFTANNNILTLVNVNEDMILETSGDAEIQLIGNVGFYKSNGGGVPEPSALFFFARDDGQITIIVPSEDPFLGAVEIIGSSTGNLIPPGAPGAMLHITGNPAIPARVYLDGNGEYASFVARRYNGNVAVPTQVLAGEDVLRINSTAATDAGVGNVAMAQIRTTALENQTTTAQGSSITFTVTPVGSPAGNRVDVANVTVANGVTATKFTTAGTISATSNITGGNILTAGLVSATGNVTGGNILGGANVNATTHTGATVSVTANITGGNILTGGILSATGNITGGNITNLGVSSVTGNVIGGNIRTAGVVTATGNITGGNILTAGAVSATGGVTSGDGISDNLGSVRSIPQNSQNANYQLQATDNGQMINMTSGNVTVPASVFATPFGQAITIFNNQNSSNAIVQGSGVTLRLAGTAATGNRTLARYGLATLVCVSANTFVISGAGLT